MSALPPRPLARGATLLVIPLAIASLAVTACRRKAAKEEPRPSPAPIVSAVATVPPAYGATPVAALADAGPEGTSPYEQARAYEANGQLWLARLVLEKKALGSDGAKQELELLSRICAAQSDTACVDQCAARLGAKPKAARRGK